MKYWDKDKIYNFHIEFNRIESYNEYCKKWLKNYYKQEIQDFTSKTNWTINDIPDVRDLNRIKTNINYLLTYFSKENIAISNQVNQVWNEVKANEIETKLYGVLDIIGEWQFSYNITGLAITGNHLKLGGVN